MLSVFRAGSPLFWQHPKRVSVARDAAMGRVTHSQARPFSVIHFEPQECCDLLGLSSADACKNVTHRSGQRLHVGKCHEDRGQLRPVLA